MDENTKRYLTELAHAQNDTQNTFKKRIRAGHIENYRPYLEDPSEYADHLITMAEEGVCVDELAKIDHDGIRCTLILNNRAKEHYPEWAQSGNRTVQWSLALANTCPDILIHSSHQDVRIQVAKNNPEYTRLLMDRVKNMDKSEVWYAVHDVLMSQTNPEPDLLKQFLRYDRPNSANLNVLKSKYKTALIEPSVIEKTMTDYQLFKAGKVLWKRNISGHGVWCIQYAKKKLGTRHELTEEDFDYIKRQDNQWNVDEYLTKYDEPIEVVSHI